VYLHGIGSAATAEFVKIARDARLVPYRAILVDLLGFGYSDRPESFPHSLEAHADVVARLLDHLGLRGCHVIGQSMGGSIAIVLAAARPDLVSALVVSECNLDPEDATFSQMIIDQSAGEQEYVATGHAAIIAKAEGWAAGEPALSWLPGTLRAADPRAVRRCAAALVGVHLRNAFFGLPMPRTYVFGAKSLPHRHERLLEAGGVPIGVVPAAGHVMMVDNAEAYAAILASTIAGAEIPAAYRHHPSPAYDYDRLAEVTPQRKG
jgi:pimeloyl-ACP methyl ester carboxylesterase